MEHTETKSTIDLSSAQFVLSAHARRDWPPLQAAEVAFAGRSNVGKSSAINVITNRRGLAKTSKTPGRTRMIVFFELDSGHRLVDLPGYGFAKVPLDVRRHWETMITDYLTSRDTLRALILPVDSRRLLTPLDEQMLNWCDAALLPVHILLTKADKLSRNQAAQALRAVSAAVKDRPYTTIQLFSVLDRQGVDEARVALIRFLADGQGNHDQKQA